MRSDRGGAVLHHPRVYVSNVHGLFRRGRRARDGASYASSPMKKERQPSRSRRNGQQARLNAAAVEVATTEVGGSWKGEIRPTFFLLEAANQRLVLFCSLQYWSQ